MVSHPNKNSEAEARYSCGCFVGIDGGTYCCRQHYDLVKLLHTDKREVDPPLGDEPRKDSP